MIFEKLENKPRPTTELEEQKICVIHELIHAFNHLKHIRVSTNEKAQSIMEEAIDKHAYTFLDNEKFFERLMVEMLFRENCRIIFHKSIWWGGRAECPFYYYYLDTLERLKKRLI